MLVMSPRFSKDDTAQYLIFAVFVAECLVFASLGHVDANEGWYWNDAVMVGKGLVPYRDFFYHRLPGLLLFYAPVSLVSTSLLWVRLFNVALLVVMFVILRALTARLAGGRAALVASLALTTSPIAIYWLVTVQSYAIVATLYLVAAYCLVSFSEKAAWVCAAVATALAISCRYVIDYPAIALAGATYTASRRVWTVAVVLPACLVILGSMTAVFALQSPSKFAYQTSTWNMSNARDLESLGLLPQPGVVSVARATATFLLESVRNFTAITIGALIVLLRFADGRWYTRIRQGRRTRAVALLALLCCGNLAFYLLAPGAAYMQMAFVVPATCVLIGVGLATDDRGRGLGKSAMVTTAAIAITGAILVPPPIAHSWGTSDLQRVMQVGKIVADATPSTATVLTWSPIFAAEANRRIPGPLAMEVYSLQPLATEAEAAARGTYTGEDVIRLLQERAVHTVVLEEGRFFSNRNLSRLLTPYRDRIERAIESNYVLRDAIPPAGRQFSGAVKVFVVRQSP